MEDNKKMKFKVEIIEILQYQEVIEDKESFLMKKIMYKPILRP